MPSLLSALLKTTQNIGNCGAVGGKLIRPDGSLQEAGSIIWDDGSCLGYGRADDPFKPEYSYVREVDFCSGACLLVRADLFKQVGKFDEHFYPAYYEEVDLCMKIRDAGHKIVFQPSALVIHYEFGSSNSKNDAVGLLAVNQEKFYHKWRSKLPEHYPPIPEHIMFARDRSHRDKTRILMIDDGVPEPKLGSGFPRSYGILECLSDLGFKVTLFPLQFPEKIEPCTYELQQKGVEIMFGEAREKLDFKSFYAGRRGYYEVIWISRPHNMSSVIDIIKDINPDQKVIYDAEALFSIREILKLELDGTEITEEHKAEMVKKEIDLIDKASLVISVSHNEREIINKYTEKSTAVLGYHTTVKPGLSSFDQRRDLLFVGGFLQQCSPNEDSIIHFVNNVYPKVLNKIDARLWIVGTNRLDTVWSLASDNIIVTGCVEDLSGYFDRCKVFIAPTRYAAGIPLKLLECLSFGLPAVVTPLLAEQLGFDEDTVLIGRSSDEFADKIVRCYTDEMLWRQLRDNGLSYMNNEYSYYEYRNHLNNLINSLLTGGNSSISPFKDPLFEVQEAPLKSRNVIVHRGVSSEK